MSLYIKYDKTEVKHERQNYIPIRHNTQIFPANHTDLEFMFYDRKNVVQDYKLEFLPIQHQFGANYKNKGEDRCLVLTSRFLVQNTGRHPLAISEANLIISNIKPKISVPESEFIGNGFEWSVLEKNQRSLIYSFPYNPLIVPIDGIVEIQMGFWVDRIFEKRNKGLSIKWRKEFMEMQQYKYVITLKSVNGRTFTSDTFEVKPNGMSNL